MTNLDSRKTEHEDEDVTRGISSETKRFSLSLSLSPVGRNATAAAGRQAGRQQQQPAAAPRLSYKADERAKSVHVATANGRRHRHRHLVHAWVNSLAGLEQRGRERRRGGRTSRRERQREGEGERGREGEQAERSE